MKRKIKSLSLWLIGAFAFVALASHAQAATSATVDIHVSISASKSVSVNTASYDFSAVELSSGIVATSSITVTNDSAAYIESYKLHAGNAIAQVGGDSNWTLDNSTASIATDHYALGAVFSNARPNNAEIAWLADYLDTSDSNCTTTVFGNGTAAQSGASVSPNAADPNTNKRALWFRIHTPAVATGTGERIATVTLSVQ